jgi:hypothetical protein
MWIISAAILAGYYAIGRWAASYFELDINRDTVGLSPRRGFSGQACAISPASNAIAYIIASGGF